MKKSFFNNVFYSGTAIFGGFMVLLAWIIYAVEPHPALLIVFSIASGFWFIWLVFVVWTGLLTRITVYPDRIKWIRHFKSRVIMIDDVKVEEILPVKHHQWCKILINDKGSLLYMGLTNSRHMALLLEILQPSKFTDILKEEKRKCDDWGFNSTI